MPSFEEDAFARAQQMHSRRQQNPPQAARQSTVQKPQETPAKEQKEASVPQIPSSPVSAKSEGFLNTLFKNKDQSLIMLLIVLLMEENSNPTLLIALIYLLM